MDFILARPTFHKLVVLMVLPPPLVTGIVQPAKKKKVSYINVLIFKFFEIYGCMYNVEPFMKFVET